LSGILPSDGHGTGRVTRVYGIWTVAKDLLLYSLQLNNTSISLFTASHISLHYYYFKVGLSDKSRQLAIAGLVTELICICIADIIFIFAKHCPRILCMGSFRQLQFEVDEAKGIVRMTANMLLIQAAQRNLMATGYAQHHFIIHLWDQSI
jgi:hypothetical protein